ncbi:putative zinc metallopeptidase [Aspergillus saccharolyticus JOP 1030-1]|uniref:Metallo-dependent hydrolase n=1 Tax=Aspergillus saccharolyticus JOP 1030-1 TaxID=1450539 RepID=A0A318Z2G8_9EURO|nr:Metallo-dependent hydrolase [Aspergillus saccharolyticus JOP 1030-1]PYH41491.1 Metallo-dependent hydrolase [Aspergillus saccharolyticus JOP 1030-1]
MPPPTLTPVSIIENVRLPESESVSTWDISIDNNRGIITSITPHQGQSDTAGSRAPLALPALTHPHIHLDKAYIHNAREYAHLLPFNGSFAEALSSTTQAKCQFTHTDLLKRGEWLLAGSVAAGVTAMRAFVEVDQAVGFTCLDAGITLRETWKDACTIQLVSFAQDPIFSGQHGEETRQLMEDAIKRPQVDVIGTTPYVEVTAEAAKRNIVWAIDRGLQYDKHVDFHLDYNLDPVTEALVWFVLRTLKEKGWSARSTHKRVMLGHCTRLTLLSREEWTRLAKEIKDNDLPVSFVGLPTSDLYMAAPPPRDDTNNPRGTLPVMEMINKHELDAVIGINNVGNAFTPWGTEDPLSLACLGVGIYQAGTKANAELLYECVSTRARAAIGLAPPHTGLSLRCGSRADFLLFHEVDESGCGVVRPRHGVAGIVWDPPAKMSRVVIVGGRRNVSSPSFGHPRDVSSDALKTSQELYTLLQQ